MELLTKIPITLLFLIAVSASSSRALAQTQPAPPDDAPRKLNEGRRKIDFLYLASETYLAAGTTLDMKSTVDGLDHPTTAYRANRTFLTHYYATESGWAKFLGKRNATGIVVANVLLNTGFDLVDRRLYRRGGRWRIAAVALNVLKGTENMADGFQNIRLNGSVDERVRLETGYTGRIIWSR